MRTARQTGTTPGVTVNTESPPERLQPSRSGVLALSGWGLSVRVRRRRLVVADGLGPRRREGAFFRASSPIKRLILIGRAGSITFEAIAWLHDTGASLVHLDWNGTILLTSAAWGNNDGRLRRLQALAPTNGTGITIARSLVADKLHGQLSVLMERTGGAEAITTIENALARVDGCASPAELMRVEAEAAAGYWQTLAPTPLTFAHKQLHRLPPHWLTLGSRSSPLTSSPRRAATPANALLNLAYGAAQAEATIACNTIGLDPALGVLHSDQRARDSMALDLLEVCRPTVDHYILNLIDSTAFAARDFREDRQGQVWVAPPLARTIAQASPLLARQLAPAAEKVAKTLAETPGSRIGSVASLLTQDARSRGRDNTRRHRRTRAAPKPPAPPRVCRTCGTRLADPNRRHCDSCLPGFRAEQRAVFSTSGPDALAQLRAAGEDPAHGDQAAQKRSQTMARRHAEAQEWAKNNAGDSDPDYFQREILSRLKAVPLRKLAAASGLSLRYCALIRRGERVPHPRHWEAFGQAS